MTRASLSEGQAGIAGTLLMAILSLALPGLVAAAETAAGNATGTATITGPAEVVDGDGLRIGPVAIRIHGIDAPEAAQDCPEAGGGEG